MKSCTLTLSIDTSLVQRQVRQLGALLEHLPKRRARKFARCTTYRLFFAGSLCQVRNGKHRLAPAAGDVAVQIRIVGLDELIAAAMRANKREI